MSQGRPKDLITSIEAIAGQAGSFAAVDESYYRDFVSLNRPQIEKLVLLVMLDRDREVARIAGGRTDTATVQEVSRFVSNVLHAISIGLTRFDAFGRLGFFARIGQEPHEVNMDGALAARLDAIAPIIKNTVR